MEKLLTAKQVADLLEVQVSTVYDWVYRKRIPYVKLGRLIRFKKTELFRWVDSRQIRPHGASPKKKARSPLASQKEFPL
jgi:excisionase family DNA binding protein